ncbi:MAG: hypothetical protein RI900_96 [Actinomycetota bacterium]
MTSIDAARALLPDGWSGPIRVHTTGGVIEALEPLARTESELTLSPGFVDLQVNGIDDVDVTTADGDQWQRLDQLLIAQGVTSWCPTLVTMPLDRYERPLGRISTAMHRPDDGRPHIAGVHLEGPFLGDAPGAHRREHIVGIDLDWIRTLPPHVAVMTLAAEQPLAVEATRILTSSGRLVALGHTRCTESEFDAAVAAGARLVTHVFNGMSGVHHREPGVAAFALTNPAVCGSLIADGVHVHPRVLHLAASALGPTRTVLVTDSVAWRAGTVGPIGMQLRDGAPRLPDGTLAGSAVTMDAAVRMLVSSGIALQHAVRAASTVPASLIGLHDRGEIGVGRRADLVALSPDLQVAQTWVAGRPCMP